mmetsp:Transcript_309/g.572  ORF Transcript_309/g.572 Transcript_309/m.572 type:complete len:109 (-) Transcript_309:85-411(-)
MQFYLESAVKLGARQRNPDTVSAVGKAAVDLASIVDKSYETSTYQLNETTKPEVFSLNLKVTFARNRIALACCNNQSDATSSCCYTQLDARYDDLAHYISLITNLLAS